MKKLLYKVLLVYIVGCSSPETNSPETYKIDKVKLTKDSFNEIIEISGSVLNQISDSLLIPTSIHIVDKYLFITETASDNFLHVVEIPNKEYLGIKGTIGAGPGEILMPWKIISSEKTNVGIFDTELGKIVFFNIDSLIRDKPHTFEYLNKDLNYSNSVVVKGMDLFYLGNPNKTDARFYNISMNSDFKEVKKFGELPRSTNKYPNLTPSEEQEVISFANLLNKGDIFIIPYYKVPFLDIYNLKNNKKTSIFGPDELPDIEHIGDIRFYYSSFVTDNFIYLLYIDEKLEHSIFGQTVLVFDFEGKPIKEYKLNLPISQIAIYNDEELYGLAYGSDSTEYRLIQYDLNQ
ncbi:hypothetical protein JYB64_18265 [Algoriphagus aestuarii]|nr:hypothetical protein [Algoriphagus aestuarii]